MFTDDGFRTVHIKRETHDMIRTEAKARGMKLYTLADEMVRTYFRNKVKD